MNKKQITAVVFLGLILGMSIGFGLGTLAGIAVSGKAVMSFIDKIDLEEVNFNVDLNETAIVEAMIPLMEERETT